VASTSQRPMESSSVSMSVCVLLSNDILRKTVRVCSCKAWRLRVENCLHQLHVPQMLLKADLLSTVARRQHSACCLGRVRTT
jgi:hypothetical protein